MDTNKKTANPKNSLTKREGVTGLIVLMILAALVWQAFTSISKFDSANPTPVIVQQKNYSDAEVYVQAQLILEKTLISPSSAKYPLTTDANIERRADNVFKVSSYVDSQNSFGATIRSNWITVFRMNEDKTVDVYQVFIDGEEVYRKEGY